MADARARPAARRHRETAGVAPAASRLESGLRTGTTPTVETFVVQPDGHIRAPKLDRIAPPHARATPPGANEPPARVTPALAGRTRRPLPAHGAPARGPSERLWSGARPAPPAPARPGRSRDRHPRRPLLRRASGPGVRAAAGALIFLPALGRGSEALRALRPRSPVAQAPDRRRVAAMILVWAITCVTARSRSSSSVTSLAEISATTAIRTPRGRARRRRSRCARPGASGLAADHARRSGRHRRRRAAHRSRSGARSTLFSDIHAQVVGEYASISTSILRRRPTASTTSTASSSPSTRSTSTDRGARHNLPARAGIKLSVVPPARGMFGTAVQLQPRRRPAGHRVQHLGRLALDPAAEAGAATSLVAERLLVLVAPLFARDRRRDPARTAGARSFFVQTRAGLGGRPFRMIKFRTMVADAEERPADARPFDKLPEPDVQAPDDPRVTRIGRLLRRHEPRRAAPAPQRAEGRHEPRRPAARAGRAGRPLRARAPVPARVKPGHDRADAGLRARAADLRGAARGRARVHREPLARPRLRLLALTIPRSSTAAAPTDGRPATAVDAPPSVSGVRPAAGSLALGRMTALCNVHGPGRRSPIRLSRGGRAVSEGTYISPRPTLREQPRVRRAHPRAPRPLGVQAQVRRLRARLRLVARQADDVLRGALGRLRGASSSAGINRYPLYLLIGIVL